MKQDIFHGFPASAPEPPVSEQPAIRMMERSADYLSDTDLLSVIIASRLAAGAALRASRDILTRAGGLHRVSAMTTTELMRTPGIGPGTACAIRAAFALASRRLKAEPSVRPVLDSPVAVADYARPLFTDKRQEEFHTLLLDTRNRLLTDRTITVGLVDRSPIHAREVFREAIRDSCSRLILLHNHPSGDPSPSPQDIDTTRQLVKAGKIIGIEVLDHIIIGTCTEHRSRGYLSLKETGLM